MIRDDDCSVDCSTLIAELMAEGINHHHARRFGEAVSRYSRVVAFLPECGEAWRLLGVAALQLGDATAARSFLERAIRIDADDAAAYSALGSVNEAEGKLEPALIAFERACAIEATHEASNVGFARVMLALGRAAEAIAIAEGAIVRGISDVVLLRTLGTARLARRDYAGAVDALRASVQIKPNADAYSNLGAAYVHLHRVEEAIAACGKALALDPTHAGATNNLGICRKAESSFPAALAAFERAAELGSEDAHINLGTTRLLLGDYYNGWPEYGWTSVARRTNSVFASLPLWDGTPSPDRRLLIWPEQGVGDTIQMVRFLRRARALVGSLTLACPPGTRDLLRTVAGVDTCIDARPRPSFDAFDAWLPTIRLPVIFDVSRESIPTARYLRADPERIKAFLPKLRAPGVLRVGLVWSGSPEFEWNDLRSCGLGELEALNDVSGIGWFALQKGAAAVEQPHNGMHLEPINAQVVDFADTAAIIDQLDLVITVDTSIAHMAGALGRPAWVLLSNRPDWRWQLKGDNSPWYPTLRLFRQGETGSWASVIAQLANALRELVSSRSGLMLDSRTTM